MAGESVEQHGGVSVARQADTLFVRPWGRWTIRNGAVLEEQMRDISLDSVSSVVLDMRLMTECDTLGAWLILRQRRVWEDSNGLSAQWSNLPSFFRPLMESLSGNERVLMDRMPARVEPSMFVSILSDTGHILGRLWSSMLDLMSFWGLFVIACAGTLRNPARFRLTSFMYHVEHTGIRAIPIVALMSFMVGAVLVQQGIFQLRSLGAELLVIDLIGILGLREIGVLITAIMLTGRSGSAFASEIGTMKLREEIDALHVMGLSYMEALVLPRVLALIIVAPAVTLVADIACLAGGALTGLTYGGISLDIFGTRLTSAVNLTTLSVGLIKAPFMAVTGLIACLEGLHSSNDASSVGKQTTSAVVKGLFVVVLLDSVFSFFFSFIGF